MTMGDKHSVQGVPVQISLFETAHDFSAAASVGQKQASVAAAQHKTGIVIFRDHGRPCAEGNETVSAGAMIADPCGGKQDAAPCSSKVSEGFAKGSFHILRRLSGFFKFCMAAPL